MIILDCTLKNVGRLKAFRCQPKPSGLTVLGGRNRQGKTTVLDALAWALGGDKYRPPDPNHRDGDTPAELDIHTDNGLHIQRKGKTGALTVTDDVRASRATRRSWTSS
jgi:DNA repair exonuclease SbcCD ATPase subunit